jgi:hypothetical protein
MFFPLAIFSRYALYISTFGVLETRLCILKNILVLIFKYGVTHDIKKNLFILVWNSISTRQTAEVLLTLTMLFLQRQENSRHF